MKALLIIGLVACAFTSWAQSFPIRDRILTQKLFLESYEDLHSDAIEKDDKSFLRKLEKKVNYSAEIAPALSLFDKHLPKPLFKALLHWRYMQPDQQRFEKVLSFALFQKILVLRDHADSPYNIKRKAAIKELQKVSEHASLRTDNLYQEYFPLVLQKAKIMANIKDNALFLEALGATKLFTYSIGTQKSITPYLLSQLGFIPGNKVVLVSQNEVDTERINWVQKKSIANTGKLDFSLEHLNMPKRFISKGNPMFKKDPIFIKIKDMIKQSKESVFIDIFLLGGTLGATLSKYLIDQTKEKIKTNPNFKVLILHDFASHKNLMSEMRPIFDYIKNRISNEKELKNNLFLLQANIQRHPSGSPFGLGYQPKASTRFLKNLEENPNHFQSKFDHSKVIVIDGNTQQPAAYFGSKNWSDSAGAFFYDDSIYIEGPAAALVQAAFYRDIKAALTVDKEELKWFFYKDEGFSNELYLAKKDEILKDFEVTTDTIAFQGSSIVRLAETDIDSKIVNTRQLLVDMIIKAQKTIYMEQQYFYDKYVVDALIKKKIEKPKVDIKVILDPNQNLELGGLPNTIFLDELIDSGILVRARKAKKVLLKSNVTGKLIVPLNHRKIIAIDSKVFLGGSSDITPNSLQGSSREFGAQVFSRKIAKSFERRFIQDWNNPDKVLIMDIENFRAKLDGKTLSKENSNLINKILSLLLRSKDQLEGRP
jgi:phosphatidylserine/phosphatidylglycerophosphate/cardiolipin synthase-like enzyme